jgi:hypothetical protein
MTETTSRDVSTKINGEAVWPRQFFAETSRCRPSQCYALVNNEFHIL